MPTKVCCVTGHRIIPTEQLKRIESELGGLILRAIAADYDTFLSGFAEGADLLFAHLVLECQNEFNVKLEAAIPYAGRLKCQDSMFQFLLARCSTVNVISEQYSSDCFFIRNRYMVDHADAVVAVYDGRKRGGTFQTVSYAREVGKKIAFVHVDP